MKGFEKLSVFVRQDIEAARLTSGKNYICIHNGVCVSVLFYDLKGVSLGLCLLEEVLEVANGNSCEEIHTLFNGPGF